MKRRTFNGLLLGVSEASALLGNSERSLRALVARGIIPYRKLGGRIVFKRSELEAFVDGLPGLSVKDVQVNLRARRC